MTAAQVSALLATVGLAFLAHSIACASLFRRVRTLTDQVAARRDEPTSQVDQVRSIEARLARLEAGADLGRTTSALTEAKRTRRLDRRQVASADGPVLIAVPSLASTPSATPTEAAAELARRFGPIWALADSGAPLDEIAERTGQPIGQVELILGLRGPKRSNLPDHGARPNRDETDA